MRADITEHKVSYPELDPGNGREVSPTSARQFKPVPIDNVTTGTLADCCVGYTQGKRRVGHISIRYFVGHISALIPDLLFPTYLSLGYTFAGYLVGPYPMYFVVDYISA